MCDKDSLSKNGESCSQEFRDLELTFSINLFFHSTITLPIYGWSEPSLASTVGWSRSVICDWFVSIKRTPACLGIVLCLISI